MNAELRALVTVEHEPIITAQPEADAFCVALRALVGPSGSPGEESFDFSVCSPAWLEAELKSSNMIGGRFLLITRTFDVRRIEDYVRRRIGEATGEDWPEVAGKIARWSHWELEDYGSLSGS
ncbi:Imm8 family immunity protein [Sphingomonas sp. RB1R13]|uniref:Imm8 family immunity protein n=1 Tax=Sphingomonas sp. RB1R13 TaxID=3096159 RepID=UPI002FC7B5D9